MRRSARSRRTERLLVTLAVVLLASLVAAGTASAWWGSTAVGAAQATTAAVPTPAAPSATLAARSVTLTWAPVTLPDGVDASSYSVRRTTAGGSVTVAACTGSTTTCVDTAVPIGVATYRVTASYRTWTSAEGPATTVNVGGPVLTLTSSASTLPATLTGTLSGAVAGSSLSFRLDDPAAGTLLAATPTTVAAGASTAVSVTLPVGTSGGAHTVYAVAGTDVTGTSVTVTASGSPTALTWVSNRDGRGRQNDVLRVTYSTALSLASLAPGDPDGNVNVVVTVADNATPNGNDLLRVAGLSGGSVTFGEINLGSRGFVNGTVTYGTTSKPSTLVWNRTARTLTLTLGGESGSASRTVSSSVTATYTPGAALRTSSGGMVTGTVSVTGVAF